VPSEGRAPSTELGSVTRQNDRVLSLYNIRTVLRVIDPIPVEGTRPPEGTNTSAMFVSGLVPKTFTCNHPKVLK